MGLPQYDMEAVQYLISCMAGSLQSKGAALRNISYRTFVVSGNKGPCPDSLYMGSQLEATSGWICYCNMGEMNLVREWRESPEAEEPGFPGTIWLLCSEAASE